MVESDRYIERTNFQGYQLGQAGPCWATFELILSPSLKVRPFCLALSGGMENKKNKRGI
jgi:hypothetical protein